RAGGGEVARANEALNIAVEGRLPSVRVDQRACPAELFAGLRGHLKQVGPEGRQGSLEVLTGASGDGRTAAGGGEGGGQVASAHQGGGDEVTIGDVVNGEHRDVEGASVRGDARVQVAVVAGAEGQGGACEVTAGVLALEPLQLAVGGRALDRGGGTWRDDQE